METINLKLKAKHFNRTRFTSNCNCAIAKAAKEHFKTKDVEESVYSVIVNGDKYGHEMYGVVDFLSNKRLAKSKAPNSVIRTIVLSKIA